MESKMLISQDSKLKAALLQRGENLSTAGLRDLRRYYCLLNQHLLETSWTENEAYLICEVLKDYRFEDDPEQARTIWKQVDCAIQQDHLDQKWNINYQTFIRKLQNLTHFQIIALVDAVERYWVRARTNSDETMGKRLLRVDLIKCCDFAL